MNRSPTGDVQPRMVPMMNPPIVATEEERKLVRWVSCILITGMKCAGTVGAVVKDKHITINSMDSSFDMDDIRINITNFNVEQFSQEELSALINSAAIIYIKQYQDFISKLGAPVVIEHLNSMIKDFTVTSLWSLVQSYLDKKE
ncbi:hypothetical protein M8J76_011564 [Diaphorina citri]|nr:hypothetical protein M8J76_011564 [Diaphorina citri]